MRTAAVAAAPAQHTPTATMTTALLPSAGAALGTENDFARKSKGTGQRKSMPKVKTGCGNCKKRRIKCDETRPVCNNCDKSQRVDPSTCKYPPPSHRPGLQPLIAPKPATPLALAAPNLRPAPPTISAREPGPTSTSQLIPISQSRNNQLVAVAPSRRDRKMELRTRLTPLDNPHGLPISSFQLPLPVPSQTQLQTLYQPPVMQFTELEGMYFQLFQQSTANELSGYFDNGFWTRSVLQEAYAETTIRHAVVALGALYKTLEKSSESPPCSPNGGIDPFDTPYRHWKAAIEQYSQALAEMRRLKELERDSGRTQLMAHVLLACFDSFIGDHKQAIRQIQNGLGLLEKLRNAHRSKYFPSSDEAIDADLIRMFTRLAIQAKTYDMAFHFPEPFVVCLTPQPATNEPMSPISEPASPSPNGPYYIPTQFSSLIEARIAWDTLVYKIFRFREVMFQTNNGPLGLLPRDIQRHGESFHRQMRDWDNAFTPLCDSRHERSSQEKQGIAALKMTYIMSFILFMMTFDTSEMNFDQFTSDFKNIVDLALEIVTDQEHIAAASKCCSPEWCLHKQFGKRDIFGNTESEFLTYHIKPSFSADMGIVQPLYVVATKCRDPMIRRQAIQLLMNSARREAMWDSELSARIGSWITQIEEEGEDFMSPTPSPHMPQGQFNPVSPDGTLSVISPASSGLSGSMTDFGDALGPGGNARWESIPRRASLFSPPPVVREDKRVMVYSVEMDLKERWAKIRCGTRGLRSGSMDTRSRETHIAW